ncbi:hypothetical protein E2C01_080407 [Portunus trituberculatus]|uniref:Uncharacterized protein n=1 Tax=Portunus trituberculatus TaxID=210409 RepID=A0A5B7IVC5_PORTR|nr:hypothetical protein [Portunus trituberculatus]
MGQSQERREGGREAEGQSRRLKEPCGRWDVIARPRRREQSHVRDYEMEGEIGKLRVLLVCTGGAQRIMSSPEKEEEEDKKWRKNSSYSDV